MRGIGEMTSLGQASDERQLVDCALEKSCHQQTPSPPGRLNRRDFVSSSMRHVSTTTRPLVGVSRLVRAELETVPRRTR